MPHFCKCRTPVHAALPHPARLHFRTPVNAALKAGPQGASGRAGAIKGGGVLAIEGGAETRDKEGNPAHYCKHSSQLGANWIIFFIWLAHVRGPESGAYRCVRVSSTGFRVLGAGILRRMSFSSSMAARLRPMGRCPSGQARRPDLPNQISRARSLEPDLPSQTSRARSPEPDSPSPRLGTLD